MSLPFSIELYPDRRVIVTMRNVRIPVLLVTLYLVLYTILHSGGAPLSVLLPMFVLSPFLVIWLVYRVLRDGTPSGKSFEEAFYDDQP